MPTDMEKLAVETATALKQRIGVDAAFVFVLRKSDDTMGGGITAGDLPLDFIVGSIVSILGHHRRDIIQAAIAQ